jgi:hypothetical protein
MASFTDDTGQVVSATSAATVTYQWQSSSDGGQTWTKAVRNQIHFAVARRRASPIVKRAHGNLPAHGRGKSGASAAAAGSGDLHVAEQPINRRGARPQNKGALIDA